MYSKKYQTLQEAYLNFYEGRGSRGETSADSEELAGKIARRAKKNPQNTDKYWLGVLRLAGRAPSGSRVIDNAKREFIKKEDLDIVLSHLLDEGYADNVESAVEIVENMSDEWMEDILESDAAAAVAARAAKLARQRKGQTPQRKEIYRNLAAQAGERANPSPSGRDLNNRTGMTAVFRRSRRGQSDWNIDHDQPGGITKNPTKLRKQKALGEFGESYNAYDQY